MRVLHLYSGNLYGGVERVLGTLARCRRLAPGIQAFARHPHVSLLELDEVADAAHWRRLNVPGSPYAIALDGGGRVLAKGTFNSIAQLESVVATAERRVAAPARV